MEKQRLSKWYYSLSLTMRTGGAILSWVLCNALHNPGCAVERKERRFIGVMSNHYVTIKWYFVGKALSFSHSANCHGAARNPQVLAWLWAAAALETQHNTAGLALSAANRHQIYGTLKLTEQTFPVNGRHVEKLLLCERLAPLPDTLQCHIPLFFLPPNWSVSPQGQWLPPLMIHGLK